MRPQYVCEKMEKASFYCKFDYKHIHKLLNPWSSKWNFEQFSIFSGLSLFEQNVTICDALLFAPEKTLELFDNALAEAQSVVMETCRDKDDMVRKVL